MLVDIIVKLNLNINVKIKYKTRVIQNICGAFVNVWVPNLANITETRTLCQYLSTDPMFSVIYLIFGRKLSRKTSIQKTMASHNFIPYPPVCSKLHVLLSNLYTRFGNNTYIHTTLYVMCQ